MNNPFDKNQTQNVGEFERAVSVFSGLMLVGKGVRRGGFSGILQLALGGMALARGYTGHCEAKRIFNETLNEKQGSQKQGQAALDQRYSICRWIPKCTALILKASRLICQMQHPWAMKIRLARAVLLPQTADGFWLQVRRQCNAGTCIALVCLN